MRLARTILLPWALVLGGCANLSGLSSLEIDPGDAGAPPDSSSDGAVDAPPVCQKSETDCTDGVDNDCNGKTDCEEASCTGAGYSCVDEVPNGQFGWLTTDAQAACPGTSQPTALVTSVTSTANTCACSCSGSATCPGTVAIDNTENGPCTTINNSRTLTLDASCHAANFDIQTTMKSTLASQTTCTPKAALPGLSSAASRICKSQLPKGGAGCASGRACLPLAPVAPFKACMIVPTSTSCPASWPVASTVGTSVTDTRSCGTCSCTQSGTCSGTVQFFTNSTCQSSAVATVPLNGCQPTGVGATTVSSYKAAVVASGGCSPTSATVPFTGSVALGGQLSLCCAN